MWLVVDYFASRRIIHRASRCLRMLHVSSSTTSPMSRVRVPRHLARLVVWLVVDYFASRRLIRRASRCLRTSHGSLSTTSPTPRVWVPRHLARLVVWLVIDYFAYVARLGASAPRAACCAARRRLLHLSRASGCLGTSRNSSCGSPSTTSLRAGSYVMRPGASTHRTARRRLLCLRRASGCLGSCRCGK
jgi:hypothetical protein